jgi:hypothetical protein
LQCHTGEFYGISPVPPTAGVVSPMQEPIDIVYLWVDGNHPGFREERDKYATEARDRDPARYRDNLDLLKYSLRGLSKYLPWVRNIYIVTCRPQRPAWLARNERIRLIYHDQFIEQSVLPLYNSNSIFCFLNQIPELSRRFIYCEDDILWTAPTSLSHFVDSDGRLRVHQRFGYTPDAGAQFDESALLVNPTWAYNNGLLDAAFGRHRRPTHTHAPLLVDIEFWNELVRRWPAEIAATKANRFRSPNDVVPVYLYRHFLLNTGRAKVVSRLKTYIEAHYHGLEYLRPWIWIGLNLINVMRPKTTCLNDNWGEAPPVAITAMIQRFLERRFATKSPFEVDDGELPSAEIVRNGEAFPL